MAIIRCKMCGGDVELAADKTFGTCEFCGNTMTFPKVDDDQRASAFNRGNHFRRIGEFDKALAVYERIVREDDTDAEAHWCCALCRFGIEYVEDPVTFEWLPTCHRASFDSFLEDVDYLAALEHSDGITQRQYRKDAAKIAEVQRGILATSQNAEPYDVFICYKESDENGDRTRDSLLAQDIYYQLTEQGKKVFFARITLEDVVGTQYEPYIFAALNSAKVMIVVGTKPEYLNAVWVKNEWSRFLALMKKDHQKLLLPCYRDMDPYDLPEQLSVLQSYDMGKIGFIQDLIRGVSKVLDAAKPVETVKETVMVQQTANTNVIALLKRGNMALEDGEWNSADGFFEEVLNQDAECPEAYLGKLMAQLHVHKPDDLAQCPKSFGKNTTYQRALRFATEDQAKKLKSYVSMNLEFLWARANEALKHGKWNEADNFLTEVLKQNGECAEAYIGKALAECHYRSLEELLEVHIKKSEIAEAVTIQIGSDVQKEAVLQKLVDAQQDHINKMVASYHVPSYLLESRIRSYYEYQKPSFKSVLEARKCQLKQEKLFWTQNENLNRAQKFTQENERDIIKETKDKVLAVMQRRVDEAFLEDKQFVEEFCVGYEAFVKEVDARVIEEHNAALQAREEEQGPKYTEAVRLLEKAKTPTELRTAKRKFIEIGDYKDSMQLAGRCKELEERYIANKQERDALLKEEYRLLHEMDKLSTLFSAKRRREIEAQLVEIDTKLEGLS